MNICQKLQLLLQTVALCNVFSMSPSLLATSLPASCHPHPHPHYHISRRIGNLIQLSAGKDINSALYCIRSIKIVHVSPVGRSICLGCIAILMRQRKILLYCTLIFISPRFLNGLIYVCMHVYVQQVLQAAQSILYC